MLDNFFDETSASQSENTDADVEDGEQEDTDISDSEEEVTATPKEETTQHPDADGSGWSVWVK